MAFTALSFVVPFFSYHVLCNLSYDVTQWISLDWLDQISLKFVDLQYLVNQNKHYCGLNMVAIATD